MRLFILVTRAKDVLYILSNNKEFNTFANEFERDENDKISIKL